MSSHRPISIIATVLALAAMRAWAGEPAHPDDDPAPLPYLRPSPDDGWITRYLRDPRLRSRSFVAGFDSDVAGCFTDPDPHADFDIILRRHGVALVFGPVDEERHLETEIRPDGSGYLGLVSFPNCTVQIGIRKSVLREGSWRVGRIAMSADIHDWDERERILGGLSLASSPDVMRFVFEADRDECGRASGIAILRAHSIVAEVPSKSGLRIVRQPGSRSTNDYVFENEACRYDLSISIATPDADGTFHPVPVSKLFAIYRPPPMP